MECRSATWLVLLVSAFVDGARTKKTSQWDARLFRRCVVRCTREPGREDYI